MWNYCNIKVYLKTLMFGGINRDSFQKKCAVNFDWLTHTHTHTHTHRHIHRHIHIHIYICIYIYI